MVDVYEPQPDENAPEESTPEENTKDPEPKLQLPSDAEAHDRSEQTARNGSPAPQESPTKPEAPVVRTETPLPRSRKNKRHGRHGNDRSGVVEDPIEEPADLGEDVQAELAAAVAGAAATAVAGAAADGARAGPALYN